MTNVNDMCREGNFPGGETKSKKHERKLRTSWLVTYKRQGVRKS